MSVLRMRLKHVATLNDDALPETTDPYREIRYIDISSVDSDGRVHDGEMTTFAAAPSRARRLVRKGDVVVSTVRTYLRAIAPINEADPSMVVSTGFAVVRPGPRLEPRFAAYALQDRAFLDDVVANSEGVAYPGIAPAKLATLRVPVPPRNLQARIADYLDSETARIDALIDRKQRFIELLLEKRTALITHAVTKGLDPNAEMKDSGVEWIGDVPVHWTPTKLKFLLSTPLMYGAAESAELDDRALPRYIRITDITSDGNLRDETFKSLPEMVAAPYLLADQDILLARSGATAGKAFIYSVSWGPAAFAGYLIRARLNAGAAVPRFFWYFTQSHAYQQWASQILVQATIPNINAEKYANIVLPVPTTTEQAAVVQYLDGELTKVDDLVMRTNQSIELLREYRTALISAAVTGQIGIPGTEASEVVA